MWDVPPCQRAWGPSTPTSLPPAAQPSRRARLQVAGAQRVCAWSPFIRAPDPHFCVHCLGFCHLQVLRQKVAGCAAGGWPGESRGGWWLVWLRQSGALFGLALSCCTRLHWKGPAALATCSQLGGTGLGGCANSTHRQSVRKAPIGHDTNSPSVGVLGVPSLTCCHRLLRVPLASPPVCRPASS